MYCVFILIGVRIILVVEKELLGIVFFFEYLFFIGDWKWFYEYFRIVSFFVGVYVFSWKFVF